MHRLRLRLASFAAAAFAVTVGAPLDAQARRSPPPDLILTGGKIVTGDSMRPWAEALAVRGDRVVAVGSTAEISRLAGGGTRRIPLGGRTVVPGFNDAHDHIGGGEIGVPFRTSDSQTPDPSLAQVADSVAALARRVPPGTWLRTEIGMRVVAEAARRSNGLNPNASPNKNSFISVTGNACSDNSKQHRWQ